MNILEFHQYKQLEAKHASVHSLYQHATTVVTMPGHTPITVYAVGDVRAHTYDFVWTRFGVVKLLTDDGAVVDKSPLCYTLDDFYKGAH